MDHLRRAIDAAARAAVPRDSIVTHGALRAAGLSIHMIQRLEMIGHLRRVLRGVYVVGRPTLTQRQLHQVALLRAGPDGYLTARTGLEVRGVLDVRRGVATATTRRTRAVGFHRTLVEMESGGVGLIRLRRTDGRFPADVIDGLRIATVGRGLADLVAFGQSELLDRAWGQAEFRGLLDEDALQREIGSARRRGEPAVAALLAGRRILTTPDTDLRGKTELPWLHLLVEAGIPMPAVNAPVQSGENSYFADYLWERYALAHELDSPDHLTPTAIARDHARDADFDRVGLHVVRFLDSLALADPAPHLETLKEALRRRGWDGSPDR